MSKEKQAAIKAVQEACTLLNGAAALARAIDVSPMFVTYLSRGDRDVPLEVGIEIEKATHGRIKVERLCPKHRAAIDYLGSRARLRIAA